MDFQDGHTIITRVLYGQGKRKTGVRERLEEVALKMEEGSKEPKIQEASRSTKGKETGFSLQLLTGTGP